MNFNVNLLFLIYDKSNKSLDKVAKWNEFSKIIPNWASKF